MRVAWRIVRSFTGKLRTQREEEGKESSATSRNWYNNCLTWNSNCFFSVSRRPRDFSYWILIASFSDSLAVSSDLVSRVSLAHLRERKKEETCEISGIAENLHSVKRALNSGQFTLAGSGNSDLFPFRTCEAARSRVKSPLSNPRLVCSLYSRNFRTGGIYFGITTVINRGWLEPTRGIGWDESSWIIWAMSDFCARPTLVNKINCEKYREIHVFMWFLGITGFLLERSVNTPLLKFFSKIYNHLRCLSSW